MWKSDRRRTTEFDQSWTLHRYEYDVGGPANLLKSGEWAAACMTGRRIVASGLGKTGCTLGSALSARSQVDAVGDGFKSGCGK